MPYEKHLPYVILLLITEQKVLRYYEFIEPAKKKSPTTAEPGMQF